MSEQTEPVQPPQSELDAEMSRYEGDYLESADLMQSPPITVTIEKVVAPNTEQDAGGKTIKRPILDVRGSRSVKRFVLSKTNERILKAWHGKKASGWIGKQITICVRYLKEAFGEKNVPTLRILAPKEVPLPMGVRKFMGSERPGTGN